MYGLPVDFDASIFVGRELAQVTFTENTVHLTFDGDLAITVESSFILKLGAQAEAIKQAPPLKSSNLMTLVGSKIRLAEATRDGTLTLHFERGETLAFLDDSKEYESYHIHATGKVFTV